MGAALRMLFRRDLSEGEIRERLGKKGFPPAECSAAIRRLGELGLVDDPKLCARLVRLYRETRGYGSAKIAWALRARGFAADLVERTLRECSSEEEELAAASAALRRKFRGGLPPGRDGAARAYRFLAGRGFPPGTCRKAIGGHSSDILEGEG
jgi:regulatory protein